jgi:hypothetical protein
MREKVRRIMPLKRHLEGVKMAMRIEERERSGVEVGAVAEERLRVPSWFGEAVMLGQYWLESGLVGYLEEEVRVERGRMGRYKMGDFVLILNMLGSALYVVDPALRVV